MGKMKDEMQENNPLLQVYMKILPLTVVAAAVIYLLVKVISGLIAPEQLILEANYADFEQGAVMTVPMKAAVDEAFTEELKSAEKQKSGFFNTLDFLNFGSGEEEVAAEDGSYAFRFEYREAPETVYVKSPEWWCPVQTDGTVVLPLENGAETEKIEDYGTIKITNVEIVKISTGVFNVNVEITAAGDAVPSDVKLNMGGYEFDEWDGSTELVYDEETGFADRTLVFRYNREALEDISHLVGEATLDIREYTVHKEYEDVEITSSLEGLKIIPCK